MANSINSRAKGCRNERRAAELITKWTGKKFERTPSSGGLNWKATHAKGDITCTVEGHYCPFCFEIKANKDINFSELLIPNKKGVKILEFWEQCSRDAESCKKIPLLMMRYDGMPSDLFYLAIPYAFFNQLIGLHMLELKHRLAVTHPRLKQSLVILTSTEFLSLPYKEIRKIAKKYLNR